MKELTYEEAEAEKKKIAQIIWDKPFWNGVFKLNKKQLFLLVESIVERLDFFINRHGCWELEDKRNVKDITFDQKCIMIESCDPDFFENREEMKNDNT